ncbi:partitioning defective 3 homolog B isoform X2 [Gouania willdenowi]|uniref:partitioning defective 3 homolog B isoform X2 n=1 Tax=Gouania willdenowi TaxID=441366 RepID=UPI001054B6F8|nr:partitioning defective 3 homolog B-like isoform X2 [Gouania willdenowi]
MKVTVTFGQTGVVVPCKQGWTVRDLIQQATQRYRKLLEQDGEFLVCTHHVEYCDGGILDPDDILSDLVEDRDKLMAVYEEKEAQQRGVANTSLAPSPDHHHQHHQRAELPVFQPITGGEIEVTSSALKSNTPLLVRSSSDSALNPLPADPEHSFSADTTALVARTDTPTESEQTQATPSLNTSLTRTVTILGEDSPLGIHVVPYCSSLSGRSLGLYIRGVEEESRSRKECLFQEDECIVTINNTDLVDKTFSQSQEIFRQAMRSPIVRLEVVSSSDRERYERSLIGQLFANGPPSNDSPRTARTKEPLPPPPPPVKAKPVFIKPAGSPTACLLLEDVAPPPPSSSSSAVAEPAVSTNKGKSESPLLKTSPALCSLATNKRGGRRLRVDLKKGSEGLGFTVVTRDSSVHGPGPILVKNILPRGAAVKDGRLQSGDRIVEVNGVDITGVGQEELVCMLRSTRLGECVSLMVLRQEDMFLPREMKEDLSRTLPVPPENGKQQLMFEVPLNDTGSAGLGISLKGNKSRETGEDLGIFIKSIIHGGAAYKDGRLHINDQLVAVNGESLLGRSNHIAMETLRRSMSQEGNVRGMIQLLVLRNQHPSSLSRSFDGTYAPTAVTSHVNGHMGRISPVTVPVNSSCIKSSNVTNGSSFMDEDEDEMLYGHESEIPDSYLPEREIAHISCTAQPQCPAQKQQPTNGQFHHVKASKSMDLVADESNVGPSVGNTTGPSPASVELGPTLGLKKSSSLESLQTAMSEVTRKNQLLPFHRPRPNMVRGRGCNESFRAAIDKSYDGPAEDDDDDGSELSSGRDTPASSSSRQGAADPSEEKKKKKTKAKKKEKSKAKGKEKEKKKAEESGEMEKKNKKKGFSLLRFGKKKEEKKEAKAALQRQKSDVLSDHEFERMKEERERIEAAHPELREPRSANQPISSPVSSYPDFEDDDHDPNYARIQSFRKQDVGSFPPPVAKSPPYNVVQHVHVRTPSPQRPPPFQSHGSPANEAMPIPNDDPFDRLYAKVNKPRGSGAASPPAPPPASDSIERIQQLRREYLHARREGMVPPYEELDQRRRGAENEPHRIPVRATDHRLIPRHEEVERQYASLPRRAPLDPMQIWSTHYPPPPHPPQGFPQSPSYPNHSPHPGPSYPSYSPGHPYARPGDPRGVDPGFYPHLNPQQRGPLRQDVPPSPTPPLRGLRYDTMTRGSGGGGYR